MYHALYRSAWLESMRKAKEAEEAQKQAEAEEKAQRKAQSSSNRGMSSREKLESLKSPTSALAGIDLEDAAEELGLT